MVVALLLLPVAAAAQQDRRVQVFVRFEQARSTAPADAPITADMLRVSVGRVGAQAVELKPATDVPVHYILMFDCSGSGHKSPNARAVRAAVPAFLEKLLRPPDRVALIDFNDEYYLDSDFTANLQEFSKQLKEKEDYRGGTALVEALTAASAFAYKHRGEDPERRVILLFSDGQDNASHSRLDQALTLALKNRVKIFALDVESGTDQDRGRKLLREAAEITGGRVFEHVKAKQAEDFLNVLRRTLDSEYVLTYTSNGDGSMRSNALEITTTQKDVVAVAPKFVWAP